MKKISVFVISMVLMLCQSAFAVNDPGLKIEMLPNQYQDKTIPNYFKMNVNGTEKKMKVGLRITNPSTESVTIKVMKGNAYTTNDAKVYISEVPLPQSSITNSAYKLTNYLSLSDADITLKPKETKNVYTTITTPPNPVGTYLGGLIIERQLKPAASSPSDEVVVNVDNNFRYVYAIVLSYPYAKAQDEATVSSATLTEVNGKSFVKLSLRNNQPLIYKKKSETFTISDGKKNISEVTIQDFKISPYNTLNVSVDIKGAKIDKKQPLFVKTSKGTLLPVSFSPSALPHHGQQPSSSNNDTKESHPQGSSDEKATKQTTKKPAEDKSSKEANSKSTMVWYVVAGSALIILVLLILLMREKRKNAARENK